MEKIADRILLTHVIQPRPLESHKGDYGRVLFIGGTGAYGGAIIMAAMAAVHSGAGLVSVATQAENIAPLHTHIPEAMAFAIKDQFLLKEQISQAHIIVIGPGLALGLREESCLDLVLSYAREDQIILLDGGALTLFSKKRERFSKAMLIFTPHQKEWERLSGLKIDLQTNLANQKGINRFPKNSILIHKRYGTKIYQSQALEHYRLNVGGPYQATGGMGDTLAGMIAAFAVQFPHVSLVERVVAASYLHSAIADEVAKDAYVVLPTRIIKEIPKWMRAASEENPKF